MELEIQRRHSAKCPDKHKGPHFLKCRGNCKIWAYGCTDNKKTYFSLKTSDLARARRRLTELGEHPPVPAEKGVVDARDEFLAHKSDRSPETARKYKRHLDLLLEFCAERGLDTMPKLTVEALDAYHQKRRGARVSWRKEVEHLRAFFRFAIARKWCQENPALQFERPALPESEEIVPYTQDEVARIIAACDVVGKYPYERLRARAMVLLLRFTGMRISDVVTLSRDHIQGPYIVRRAIKNKRWIKVELKDEVRQALDALPHPKAAARGSRMFFAGQGSIRSLVKGAERLLWSVFKIAQVKDAYPHRFRHTYASELLARGVRIELVADMLGDSVDTVRRHYQKWMPQWQAQKDEASRLLGSDQWDVASTGSSTKSLGSRKTQ